VREKVPGFCFMAEVYWDLEWTMQQQGFDYAYDKRLYDRLREGHAHPVREHFHAGLDYQKKLARFLENHDEPRAAATFPKGQHEAAAIVTFLAPGLRFFHQGQFEGRLKRISPHLCRAPVEATEEDLQQFYQQLLAVLGGRRSATVSGVYSSVCRPGRKTGPRRISGICVEDVGGDPLLVTINYAPHQSQCYVQLPFRDLAGRTVRLKDMMGPAEYDRAGDDLASRGFYLDLPPWGYHVFTLTPTLTTPIRKR